jgi:hypothetical protein
MKNSSQFSNFSASALWDYLNQPLGQSHTHFILNPLKFTRTYRVKYLEKCWAANYEIEQTRERLETCWCKPCEIHQNV